MNKNLAIHPKMSNYFTISPPKPVAKCLVHRLFLGDLLFMPVLAYNRLKSPAIMSDIFQHKSKHYFTLQLTMMQKNINKKL